MMIGGRRRRRRRKKRVDQEKDKKDRKKKNNKRENKNLNERNRKSNGSRRDASRHTGTRAKRIRYSSRIEEKERKREIGHCSRFHPVHVLVSYTAVQRCLNIDFRGKRSDEGRRREKERYIQHTEEIEISKEVTEI